MISDVQQITAAAPDISAHRSKTRTENFVLLLKDDIPTVRRPRCKTDNSAPAIVWLNEERQLIRPCVWSTRNEESLCSVVHDVTTVSVETFDLREPAVFFSFW